VLRIGIDLGGTKTEGVLLERDGGPRTRRRIPTRAAAGYLAFFGEGLARLIHVLDPDAIVLGGGLSKADVLYERGPAAIERNLFDTHLRTPILRPLLGDSAGVFGAAWLAPDVSSEATPPVS